MLDFGVYCVHCIYVCTCGSSTCWHARCNKFGKITLQRRFARHLVKACCSTEFAVFLFRCSRNNFNNITTIYYI